MVAVLPGFPAPLTFVAGVIGAPQVIRNLGLQKEHDIRRKVVIKSQADQLTGEKGVGIAIVAKIPVRPELRSDTHVTGNRQLAGVKYALWVDQIAP